MHGSHHALFACDSDAPVSPVHKIARRFLNFLTSLGTGLPRTGCKDMEIP